MIYPVRSLLSYSEQYSHIILFHGVNSQNGFYFVTICTKNKKEYFGKINDGEMVLNDYGEIANQLWLEIPDHFEDIKLDESVIIPNHLPWYYYYR